MMDARVDGDDGENKDTAQEARAHMQERGIGG
jgi:hypothetical protein